tara:strand:- start:45 stop:1562 length:1518 start_codon:yes stop_codon:yes gene_type:complete
MDPILFLAIALAHTLPVFLIDGFVTIDGPAHLYNSYLIYQLLFEEAGLAHQFYELNSFWVPNASGHYLLVFLQLIFSPIIAEKVLISGLIIAQAYALRYFWLSFSKAAIYLVYLAFPLIFSLTFFFGFYNYTVGLVFYLLLLGYAIRRWDKLFDMKQDYLFLFVFIGISYFSHSLCFGLALLSLFLLSISIYGKDLKRAFYYNLKLGLIAIPFLIMFLLYLFSMEAAISEWIYSSPAELWGRFTDVATLVAFSSAEEVIYTQIIGIVLLVLLILTIVKTFGKQESGISKKWRFGIYLLLLLIVLYVSLPELTSDGGIITFRIHWFMLLIVIAMISTQRQSRLVKVMALIAIGFAHIMLCTYYWDAQTGRAQDLNHYKALGGQIQPNSVVLPLCDFAWDRKHFSNIVGLKPNTIVLYNYEAPKAYFPLKYKQSGSPKPIIEGVDLYDGHLNFLPKVFNDQSRQVDYLIIHKHDRKFPQMPELKESLETNYELVEKKGSLSLYRMRD